MILTALFLWSCQGLEEIVNTDPGIAIERGMIFFHGRPFTGKLIQKNPALDEVFITTYKNGFEDGEYLSKKNDGQLLEQRFYKNGEKQGIHRGWYPDGKDRFYSEFENGKYINENWNWFENGLPSKYEKFDRNGRILATKVWSRTGQIYMNLAYNPDGSSVGLPGSKICKPIEPETNRAEK